MRRLFLFCFSLLVVHLVPHVLPAQRSALENFITPYEKMPTCKCWIEGDAETLNNRIAHCNMPGRNGADVPQEYDFVIYTSESGQQMIGVIETADCVTEMCDNTLDFYLVTDTGFAKSPFRLPEPEQNLFLHSGYYFDKVYRQRTFHEGDQFKLVNDSTIHIEYVQLVQVTFGEGDKTAEYAEFSSSMVYHLRGKSWIPDLPKVNQLLPTVWQKLKSNFNGCGYVVDRRGYTEILAAPDDEAAIRGVVYGHVEVCFKYPEDAKAEWVEIVSRSGIKGYVRFTKLNHTRITK